MIEDMTAMKMFDKADHVRRYANEVLNTILYAAHNFEHVMTLKPTVF